jgi:Cu(I)/Ag(I) efflux system membrane fusion protein/cobalt-zinc-cadmium efflux system membrane fusion protein
MNIRRYLPGLLLGLVVLLIAGGLLSWRGYRLMQHISAPGPPTSASEVKEGRKIKHWVSSMDPKYVSDKPGKDPMGMDLVPVYEDAPGMGPRTIAVDPQTLQSMGVRTAKAEIRPLSRTIRAVGKVAYDERRLALVNTKMDGWVDRLFIKTTGELVKKGQPLLSLYSRELVPAQQEYLLALRYQQSLAKSPFPEIAEGGNRLAEASRRRLEYFDISPSQIEALEKTGKVKKV